MQGRKAQIKAIIFKPFRVVSVFRNIKGNALGKLVIKKFLNRFLFLNDQHFRYFIIITGKRSLIALVQK